MMINIIIGLIVYFITGLGLSYMLENRNISIRDKVIDAVLWPLIMVVVFIIGLSQWIALKFYRH